MYEILLENYPKVFEKYPGLIPLAKKIGNTSLIEVPTEKGSARIFAKLEGENPFKTIKDRAALAMLCAELDRSPDKPLHILEYTGGSLGISLSALCEAVNIPLTLVVSSSFDKEMANVLETQGTKIYWVDSAKGFWAVIERAHALASKHPSHRFLFQHENPANLWAHQNVTGPEILKQWKTIGKGASIDAWVASIGTGGTLMGVYEALRSAFPEVSLFATSPIELPYGSEAPPNGLSKFAGSGGLGCGRKQKFVEMKEKEIRKHYLYPYSQCVEASDAFFALTGISIGTSAAANWLAAKEIAQDLGHEKLVLTVFPSRGAHR